MKVIKRDGSKANFDIKKIISAINKAFEGNGKNIDGSIVEMLALRASADFTKKVKNDEISVELIQDSVEKVLSASGYTDIAKSYILYRKQHEKMRNIDKTLLNYKDVVDNYLKINDWRVKENATVPYSLGGLILANSGAISANYWLSEVYDEEVAKAHKNCDFHLHDLSMLAPYCAGWSLKQLITEGLGGVTGKITSAPAKHLSTLCNQMVNFLGIMQNEWAGAQAFSSFDTYLAPFVKVDSLTYKQTKQCIQSFIFGINTPSRWGCVPISTKVLTPEGWKSYKELEVGDEIMTWEHGVLKPAPLKHIIKHKNDFGILHRYIGKDYVQTVTPEHRCLVESGGQRGTYIIKQSMDIFGQRSDLRMPVSISSVLMPNVVETLSDDEIRLAAMMYTDGTSNFDNGIEIVKSPLRDNGNIARVLSALNIQYIMHYYEDRNLNRYCISQKHRAFLENLIGNKYKIDDKFLNLSPRQAKIFIETWAAFDGSTNGRLMCQCDNQEVADALEYIMLRAGWMSHRWSRKKPSDKKATNYVYADTRRSVVIQEQEEVQYDGMVWCPNTEIGTAVYKDKDGNVFISGNCQAPFSNITLDWTVPDDMKNLPAIVGGKEMNFTYNDCKKEMDMINKAFIETMIEGDANGRGFQYPIPTYSITKDFDWSETENNKLLFEMTAKYGTPYFSNYVNSDMEPSDVRSMCCRLRLDLRELRKKSGGFFGSGESTGSIGVVTINLPKLAYLSENETEFYSRLDHLMDLAARSLDTKRSVITGLMEKGLYPYTKHYLGTLDNHFSTLGLVGMNEAALNAKWLKVDLTNPKAQKFAKDVLNHMRERLADYQEKYKGTLFNLEATPAESTTYRFAKHDKEQYPDIITANMNETPYYTNSSHLPVGYTEDIFSALDVQDELQTLYTSGTVFHAFLGEKLPSWKSAAELVRKIAENYKLPYYTMSPTYSVCKNHGYLTGEQYTCPICGEKTEVNSRITGYYRPIQNWNDGKAQEFKDRKTYAIGRSKLTHSGPITSSGASNLDVSKDDNKDVILLFKTPTCPNCKAAAALLDKHKVEYQAIDANEQPELCNKYEIMQAPTLVLIKNGEIKKYRGVSDIRGWLFSK